VTVSYHLPRCAPEAQGISSGAILGFVEAAEREVKELHSFMLLRHGHVVAEGWWAPYAAEKPHMLFSLSKSFTATAIGLAIEEGLLSLDDAVLSFFPDDAPAEVSAHLAAMRVRHLLAMSTGHTVDTTQTLHEREDGNWARAFLELPVEQQPGTHFLYNTGATYMLSAILQRLTGITLLEYLQPRLLTPLGIEGATWERCPRGVNTGGYGMSTTTEAIANFGQLYLQDGAWRGEQLLPQGWVAEASSFHSDNSVAGNPSPDWAQGYGFQFWRCRHGAYRGDGAFGQYCVIMPEQDVVVAITGGLQNMQAVLDLVWERLLPACGPEPLPADEAAHGALQRKLGGLRIAPPAGLPAPALAEQIAGRTYRFAPNDLKLESLTLSLGEAGTTLTVRDAQGDQQIVCGDGAWRQSVTRFMSQGGGRPTAQPTPRPIAAAGGWTADDTYLAKLYYVETPFCVTLACTFAGERLLLDVSVNVSFGPTTFPQIEGRAG
jgi:CubicO group peptidase (beta-lactamase class C family)